MSWPRCSNGTTERLLDYETVFCLRVRSLPRTPIFFAHPYFISRLKWEK